MKTLLSAFILLMFLQGWVSSSLAGECLKIASMSPGARLLTEFMPNLQKVFKNAGICAEYSEKPKKRLEVEMQKGRIDVEFLRVKAYAEANKDYVIPLPTPIVSAKGHLVTRAETGFKPKNLDDVGDKIIGIVHGFSWQENLAKNLKKVEAGRQYLNLITWLTVGRIDGFFVEDAAVEKMVEYGFFAEGELHLSEPLVDLSMHIILHKKHVGLVEKLDREVRKIKAAGGFDIP